MLNASPRRVNKNSLTSWYVLKTSWRYLCKTSSKRLEDLLKMSWRLFSRRLEHVLKMSWRCLEDVLKTSSKRLEDILKMSWRRFWKASWRRLEDVSPSLINWSWPRRLEDVLMTSSEDVRLRRPNLSWSRRLQDVFIKSNVCWGRRLQHLFSVTSLRLKDVLENKKLLRWRRPEDVLMTCLEGVLKTRLKRSWRHV